jgi:hypothetical protein
MVALTGEPVYRGLAYLRVLNDDGVEPSRQQIDKFVTTPEPKSILMGGMALSSAASMLTGSVAGYLLSTGLAVLTSGGKMTITPAGKALLAGMDVHAEPRPNGSGPLEIVGRLDDPVVYSQLLTEIDKLDGALVVDPYLPSTDLLTLMQLPGVARVLTRDLKIAGEKQVERRRHLAIALGSRPGVELRFLPTDVKELHDRYVIARHGSGISIGTSLGGTQVTVVQHLGPETVEVLRDHYNALWDLGDALDPIVRADEVIDDLDAPPAG